MCGLCKTGLTMCGLTKSGFTLCGLVKVTLNKSGPTKYGINIICHINIATGFILSIFGTHTHIIIRNCVASE